MTKYYAVARGRQPGIYNTWTEVKKQVDGYNNAKYKLFELEEEATEFINSMKRDMKTLDMFMKVEDPKEDNNSLIVFTDGSARGNGRANAVAGFAVVWPYHQEFNFSSRLEKNELHTNNRAEYHALLYAFKQADIIDPDNKKTLIVYTDSMLLINSLTQWVFNWKRNDWRKSDGEIIANIDLVKELDANMSRRKISLKHVNAHTGKKTWEAIYNDMVDKMAQQITL